MTRNELICSDVCQILYMLTTAEVAGYIYTFLSLRLLHLSYSLDLVSIYICLFSLISISLPIAMAP